MSYSAPPPTDSAAQTDATIASESPPDGRRRWKVGTLVYTSGGLALLFFWLLWGDFAWQMRERSASPVLQVMLKQFKASDFLTGLFLASLPAALTILIAPVVSYRSDRYRSSRGRRIPFLLASTPFAAGAMFLLAASPALGSHLHVWLGSGSPGENTCILIMIGLSWTVFEAAAIIANALFGALINDVVPGKCLADFTLFLEHAG